MPGLCRIVRGDSLEIAAAVVGRFYRDGLQWALSLSIPDLIRWHDRIGAVREREPPSPVAVYRPR